MLSAALDNVIPSVRYNLSGLSLHCFTISSILRLSGVSVSEAVSAGSYTSDAVSSMGDGSGIISESIKSSLSLTSPATVNVSLFLCGDSL